MHILWRVEIQHVDVEDWNKHTWGSAWIKENKSRPKRKRHKDLITSSPTGTVLTATLRSWRTLHVCWDGRQGGWVEGDCIVSERRGQIRWVQGRNRRHTHRGRLVGQHSERKQQACHTENISAVHPSKHVRGQLVPWRTLTGPDTWNGDVMDNAGRPVSDSYPFACISSLLVM